ncbi:hypothetical protein Bind_0049 [Beijerinckia indica subsp. indica ATCC 9039]|uniref:Lipoprotein n=2 Tax=Beijerinckia TaxID=532 RepID=B2IB08_BEII9|nr:hypothetical protein Bind_0049 [Beijerinckia indica subsp. indica ATCC 9039]
MVLAGLCLLGLGVAGCGRRGPPEPPPGALSAPSEQAVQEANPYSGSRYGGVEQSDGGSATIGGVGGPAIGQALDQPNQPVQSKSQGKPKKSFFLDPLL